MEFPTYEERTDYLLKEERDNKANQLRELGRSLNINPDYTEELIQKLYQCNK